MASLSFTVATSRRVYHIYHDQHTHTLHHFSPSSFLSDWVCALYIIKEKWMSSVYCSSWDDLTAKWKCPTLSITQCYRVTTIRSKWITGAACDGGLASRINSGFNLYRFSLQKDHFGRKWRFTLLTQVWSCKCQGWFIVPTTGLSSSLLLNLFEHSFLCTRGRLSRFFSRFKFHLFLMIQWRIVQWKCLVVSRGWIE